MNIKKLSLLTVTLITSVTCVYSESNGIWHNAEDIRPGIFGNDETTLGFIFQNELTINSNSNSQNSQIHFNSQNNKIWTIGNLANTNDFSISKQGQPNTFKFLSSGNLELNSNSNINSLFKISSGASSSHYSGIEFLDKTSTKWSIGKNNQNNFYIDESGIANRLTINQGGNVGIGILNPNSKLDVNGEINSVSLKTGVIKSNSGQNIIIQLG